MTSAVGTRQGRHVTAIVEDDDPLRDRLARASQSGGLKCVRPERLKGDSSGHRASSELVLPDLRIGPITVSA